MWLNSFFSKTKKNECEDTIQQTTNEDKVNEDKVNEDKVAEDKLNKDKVNEESIKILSNNEEESIIKTDLQERVEHVKIVHANLQALQNKQDLHLNNDTTNTKKNEEVNNCKIEEILRIIPVLEKNIHTLTKKVSFLSGLINLKQLNSKIETDQNIILNNSSINSQNSKKELSIIDNTTTAKKKNIVQGKVSIKNKKTTKNNPSVTKNKNTEKPERSENFEKNLTKIINENDPVTNSEISTQNNTNSIDQLSDYLDERLECFFTKIQSALSQFKIDKINEKCEIMVHLSDLDNKMNTNEMNIDKLTYSVQQLSKENEQEIMKNQSNIKTENKQELQKSIDDIKMCIDYLIRPNSIDVQQNQQFTDIPIKSTNIKSECTSDRCVCQLINNSNVTSTANIDIINSKEGHNQIKYGDIILCEFLNAKLTAEMFKQSEHQNMAQVNQFSNITAENKTCNLSVCSKKSNHILNNSVENQIDYSKTCNLSVCSKKSINFKNNCDGNQIDDNKTCNLSVCSKKSINFMNNCGGNQIYDNLNNNCDQQQNEEKMNHITVCTKQSIHNFSKFGIENDTESNPRISKKSVYGKNQICEFLSSQPIPEWIRGNQNVIASDNPCNNPPTDCHLNSSKLYNIERIVKDTRLKNNTGGIVYKITEKQDVSGEDKNAVLSNNTL